jgi:trehalose 6-phosphate synthase
VCFIQVSAPSRTRIAEYAQQRREVEGLVGNINGRFGEEDWVPVRYLFRAYSQRDLAAFYREADVCLVSPLRDGMNLVAKEYVAAQTGDPGVLVLSRFAGAAKELEEAILVNPYDLDATALALARALDMPLEERTRRQAALLARVEAQTAARWAEAFERDLAGTEP